MSWGVILEQQNIINKYSGEVGALATVEAE